MRGLGGRGRLEVDLGGGRELDVRGGGGRASGRGGGRGGGDRLDGGRDDRLGRRLGRRPRGPDGPRGLLGRRRLDDGLFDRRLATEPLGVGEATHAVGEGIVDAR